MSEFKGTPGPWFAGRLIKEGDDYGSISVGPYPLRENKDFHYEDTICQLDEGEHDISANARLIAAAPDLLEALMLMVDTFSDPGAGEVDRILVTTDARNAIKKALQS